MVRDEGTVLHVEDDILTIDMRDAAQTRGKWHGRWPGVIRPKLEWTTQLLDSEGSTEAVNMINR